MAVEVGLDDDLYFADLNRQISLLIAEDDDDDDDDYQVSRFSSTAPQGYARSMIRNNTPILPAAQYNMYQESSRRDMMCKGTGVFIPQSTQPRRKHKPGKRSSPSYAAKSNNNNNNKQLVNSKSRINNTATNTNPAYATQYFNRY